MSAPQFRCIVCHLPVHSPETHAEYGHNEEVEKMLERSRKMIVKRLTKMLIVRVGKKK